jgi:hypothetical protein
MATPPPIKAGNDAPPPAESAPATARRTAGEMRPGATGCAEGLEPPFREREPAAPDPPEPPDVGGLIPAPNGVSDAPAEVEPPPVCLAWLSGSAYSFAAGDPGSTCTPGSSADAGATAVAPTPRTAIATARSLVPMYRRYPVDKPLTS